MNFKMLRAVAFGLTVIIAGPAAAVDVPVYLVVASSTNRVVLFQGSQAAADAVAATDPNWTSIMGAVMKPDAVTIGWHYTSSLGFHEVDNRSDTQKLREAAADVVAALQRLRRGAAEYDGLLPEATRFAADALIYDALQGAAVVLTRSEFSLDRKIAWAAQMARGPDGATTGAEFLDQVFRSAAQAPAHPIVWVNPRLAAVPRVNLRDAITLSGPVDTLTPSALNLLRTEIGFTLDPEGAWTQDLLP